MTHVDVRPGKLSDLNDVVSVNERSNLTRRQGDCRPEQDAWLR